MYKTLGILAHVDAGKTTFSEQLLYHTKQIQARGRVDHQAAYLDNHQIEKQRGMTIFADQASFSFNDSFYTIIDTPGHVDFSPEMERVLQVMDYAVLIISAVDGIQGHSKTVWQLLRTYQIPTFIFINKTDREEADEAKVLEELHTDLSPNIYKLDSGDGISKEQIEWLAERDEELFEIYLDTGYDEQLWFGAEQRLINEGRIFPYGSGSALRDEGVLRFIEQLDYLTKTDYNPNDEFSGQVYKIRHDAQGNRLTYLKVLSGELTVRDEVQTGEGVEKVTQLHMIHGKELRPVQTVQAGVFCAVSGLMNSVPGDGIGAYQTEQRSTLIPTLKAEVLYDEALHMKEVLQSFKLLDREEPSLQVQWDEYFQAIYVHVLGVIQLEVLAEVMYERFGYEVHFGQPEILYKETIVGSVYGSGHFEPLRHYAEVHLKIEPGERNSGIVFKNVSNPNDLAVGYKNLVKQHLLEKEHHGILTGSPVTDLVVTLLTGAGHQQHTSGGDFKEATYRALRQGLEKAGNRLLEPYYIFKIKVTQDQIGKILADIEQACGQFEAPEMDGLHAVVSGYVPVKTFMDYPQNFASFTKGKGTLTLAFSGYGPCHNSDAVIKEVAYDKDADSKYTSSSIFCARGVGYTVPWNEADEQMHIHIERAGID